MIDIKEDKNKEIAATPVAASGATIAAPSIHPEKSQMEGTMSRGEKWYNRLVYNVLNYWVNLGLSLVVTDFFLHGRGKGFFQRCVKGISDQIVTTKLLGRVKANRFSEIAISTFTLNSGGNILLVPTKFLEDNKRPIVHWLNKKLGVDQRAPDGHEQTPDEIYIAQEQPPQGWGRMIWRRVLGLIATTSTGLAIDWAFAKKLDRPKDVNGDKITHKPGQEVFTESLVGGAKYVLDGLSDGKVGKKIVKDGIIDRYIGYAALDWIYTAITSTILHRTNGAGKRDAAKVAAKPAPVSETPVDKKDKATVVAASPSLEEKYKKKSILPVEKYTDRAQAGEPDYTMAP